MYDQYFRDYSPQPKMYDHAHGASVSYDVPVYSPSHAGILVAMCVKIFPKVALDSADCAVQI